MTRRSSTFQRWFPFAFSVACLFAFVVHYRPGAFASSLDSPGQSAATQSGSTNAAAQRNFNQGETYFNAKNYTAAISNFKAAIAADPSFASAYYSLGLSYYEQKNPQLAADTFKQYVKLKGSDAAGFLLLGISLKDPGKDSDATDAFQVVINLKPEPKYLNSAYYNMGVAYEDAGQLPEAMRTYIVLRTISPVDAQDLLDYMRKVDPALKEADAGSASPATTKPVAPPKASPPVATPTTSANSYQNAAGNFSATFPGQTKESALPSDGNQFGSITQSADSGVTFMVTYVYNQMSQTVDQTAFNAFRDRFLQNLATCRTLSETASSPSLADYQSKAYRLNCVLNGANKLIIGNLYWGKHYSYAALTISLPSPSDSPSIRKFLDSFALIDPAK